MIKKIAAVTVLLFVFGCSRACVQHSCIQNCAAMSRTNEALQICVNSCKNIGLETPTPTPLLRIQVLTSTKTP